VEFFIRHKNVVAFIGFSLFCIISLSLQSNTFTLSIEGIGSALVSPFQKGYDGVQSGVSKLWKGFTELSDVREELQKTRKKLHDYELVLDDSKRLKRQLLTYKEQLGYKKQLARESLTSVSAEVVSKDPDNWFSTIVINKGEDDGIKINMPVIAYREGQKAIVGKIVEVRDSYALIRPVISSDIRVGVKLEESRFPGLLQGYSINTDLCVINYISKAVQVKPGDMVITSGQGGVFPEGLYVGMVVKSNITDSGPYQKAIIKPIIDFNILENVFVLTKKIDKDFLSLIEDKE